MVSLLESLRDVAGVVGGFAVDDDGELVTSAMPSYVGADDLQSIAPRIQWLLEASAELQVQAEWVTMYFTDYNLQVAPFNGGKLVVLVAPEANTRALRMAAKILCRKLEKIVDGSASARNSSLPLPESDRPTIKPPAIKGFEVRGHGRLAESGSEAPEQPPPELRNTQPSLEPPVVNGAPPSSQPPHVSESASPEARSSRRPTGPRSMVYRGRRYDVNG